MNARILSRSRLMLLPLVMTIVAMVFAASPARAGENTPDRVYTYDSNHYYTGWGYFEHNTPGSCNFGDERVWAQDAIGGDNLGIEVHAYWQRENKDWVRVGVVRAWGNDVSNHKCVNMPEGRPAKISVWQYNSDGVKLSWTREDGYGIA